MDELQQLRKTNGEKAEHLISKFFSASDSCVDDYDLESKNYLIEVKSCQASIRQNSGRRFGRFLIEMKNHVGLYLYGQMKLKHPVYVFCVKIRNQHIWIKKTWDEVNPLITAEKVTISWPDIIK